MRVHAALAPDSVLTLTKAVAKAAAASSLAWVKIAPPTKGLVKSPSPKAVVASPVGPAPSLRFQTALTAVENSEASIALALGSIVWPVRAASELMPAPRPMKCNATQPVAASKTLARPARPWTARPQPALAASMAPVRNLSKPFACRSLAHSVVLVSIVAASFANNPALKTWTTTDPLISTTSCHSLQHGAHVAPAMKTSMRTERWTLPTCSWYSLPTVIVDQPPDVCLIFH